MKTASPKPETLQEVTTITPELPTHENVVAGARDRIEKTLETEEKKIQGFQLMDPRRFKAVPTAEIEESVRPHHVLSMSSILLKDGVRNTYYDRLEPEVEELATILFSESDTNFNEE